MDYILALDQGTSSSKAAIFDQKGLVLGLGQVEYDNIFPQDGWVEQNPDVLWDTILAAASEAISQSQIQYNQLSCIGITNQRETILVWERSTGKCLYNAIIWQDRRTSARCEEIKKLEISNTIKKATGLLIDPYFSATKVQWILDEVEGARAAAKAGDLCFGTVDTYLIWRLTGGSSHLTDATNASRTLLYDINASAWSNELTTFFDIPVSMLPGVCDSAGYFGNALPEFFGKTLPITGVAGDQQAALFGQACFQPGMAKITFGTGCFAMVNTGNERVNSNHNLLTTIAYQINGESVYALEGSIFVAGAAIKWLRDQMRFIETAAETEKVAIMNNGDAKGVVLVPAFTGLGAPYWSADARGLISGMTLDTSTEDIIIATLQSIGFQTADLIEAILSDGATIAEVRVDGGMVSNSWLCQYISDILGIEVRRPVDTETTILGAAMLAALGHGLQAGLHDISEVWNLETVFSPQMVDEERESALERWHEALRRTLLD